MSDTPAQAPAPEYQEIRGSLKGERCGHNAWVDTCEVCDRDATIASLTAENERLNAVNALMEYAAFPSAEDAKDAERWIAANPGRPLSDYCPPGGLLVKRLTAEVERLRAALDGLVKHESSIMTDVLSAHRNRGNGASQWMFEDDADFRRNLRQAFETVHAALKEDRT